MIDLFTWHVNPGTVQPDLERHDFISAISIYAYVSQPSLAVKKNLIQ